MSGDIRRELSMNKKVSLHLKYGLAWFIFAAGVSKGNLASEKVAFGPSLVVCPDLIV